MKYILLLLLMIARPVLASGPSWPDVPAPTQASLLVVADRVDVNHMPMRIWTFNSPASPSATLGFYRNAWSRPFKTNVPPYQENEAGQWQIISRVDGNYLITLQLDKKQRYRSTGFLAISWLAGEGQRLVRPDYPKLPGTRVLQELDNHDPGKDAVTFVLENGYSVPENRAYYRRMYLAQGWTELGNGRGTTGKAGALILQKGPLEATFSFEGGSKTHIVGVVQY